MWSMQDDGHLKFLIDLVLLEPYNQPYCDFSQGLSNKVEINQIL